MRYASVLKGAASSSGSNMQLLSSRRSNTSQRNKQTKLYQLGTPPAFGGQQGGAGAGGTPSFGQGSTSFGKAPQGGGFGQQQSQSGFGKSPQGGGFGQQQQSGFGKSPAGGGFGQPPAGG